MKYIGGDEPIDSPAPEPHTGDALSANHLAGSCLDSTLNLPPGLDEPVILETTWSTTTGMDPLIRVSDTSSEVN